MRTIWFLNEPCRRTAGPHLNTRHTTTADMLAGVFGGMLGEIAVRPLPHSSVQRWQREHENTASKSRRRRLQKQVAQMARLVIGGTHAELAHVSYITVRLFIRCTRR